MNAASTGQLLEVVSYWTFPFPTSTGGAIDIFTIAHFSIHNTNFSSNTALAGGAIAMTIDVDSIDAENRPTEFIASVSNCIFCQNQANNTEEVSDVAAHDFHMGGAMYVVPNSIKVLWLRTTFPLFVLAFFIVANGIAVFRRRWTRTEPPRVHGIKDYVTIKSYSVVTIIVVAFFSYISVTTEFIRTANCIRVDQSSTGHRYDLYAVETGDRVWAEDTSLYCFRGDHIVTGVLGILGLIFFSMTSILFILLWLPRNASRLDDPAFISLYGFIYQGYKEQWYATPWEAVIAIRKALIAAVVVFAFPLGPNLQGICAMGVIILAIALQSIVSPFKSFDGHPNVPAYAGQVFRSLGMEALARMWVSINNKISLNDLEKASLMASLTVFYSGILFYDENTSRDGKFIMAAFTFAINLGFFAYALYRLYTGAHVSVDLYCAHLKMVDPSKAIPDGTGVIGLLLRAIIIYQNRDVF